VGPLHQLCEAVNREWKRRVTSRWPKVVEQCAQSLGHMILNGSRLTSPPAQSTGSPTAGRPAGSAPSQPVAGRFGGGRTDEVGRRAGLYTRFTSALHQLYTSFTPALHRTKGGTRTRIPLPPNRSAAASYSATRMRSGQHARWSESTGSHESSE
jgi:hypothetical protein